STCQDMERAVTCHMHCAGKGSNTCAAEMTIEIAGYGLPHQDMHVAQGPGKAEAASAAIHEPAHAAVPLPRSDTMWRRLHTSVCVTQHGQLRYCHYVVSYATSSTM